MLKNPKPSLWNRFWCLITGHAYVSVDAGARVCQHCLIREK